MSLPMIHPLTYAEFMILSGITHRRAIEADNEIASSLAGRGLVERTVDGWQTTSVGHEAIERACSQIPSDEGFFDGHFKDDL